MEVLRGLLTPYAAVALEHDRRISIHAEQRIVVRLIKKARTVDPRKRALFVRADVHQLERRAALDQRFQFRRRQLANQSFSYGSIAQGLL